MLVARRDPPFHAGAHEPVHPVAPHAPLRPPRFMTALQMVGSLLAIPVGLASAYSIYHANFSAEAQCQGLRANIVSMLDKSADASTVRMLVRRDVVAFEHSCGAVDPDAVTAFRKLLAQKTAAPAPSAPLVPPPQATREETPAKETPKPAPVKKAVKELPKEPARESLKTLPAPAEAKPAKREAAASDANWIASVREALVHAPAHPEAAGQAAPPAAAPSPVMAAPPPAARPVPPPAVNEAPPMQLSAPVLPAPVPVTAAPAAAPAGDHPVPPGSIPQSAAADQPAEKTGPSWMAKIPLLNRVVGQ